MLLTTITPYWGRPEILTHWLNAMCQASRPDVYHLIIVVDEDLPKVPQRLRGRMSFIGCKSGALRSSIGRLHNLGAQRAATPWIMKLDVDAFPHFGYFDRLLRVLRSAKDGEWFNGGMFYLSKPASETFLHQPLTVPLYENVVRRIQFHSAHSYRRPAATNFICLRDDYLELGGCDDRFQGWGWEDYQQIYMLEKHQLGGEDPLPGLVTADNVTTRCREEISRRKARELFEKDPLLALLHHYHPASEDRSYRSTEISEANRAVLLDYILRQREGCLAAH